MVQGLSIRAVTQQQQQADGIVQYLSAHGQQVGSLDLAAANWEGRITLSQLPHHMMQGLTSLKFCTMSLQLQPGGGFQGVLGAAMPLQQLELECCTLLDGVDGLASAVLQLPDLQHLNFVHNMRPPGNHITRDTIHFPSSILQGLQQLTYLELKIFQGGPKGWESDATICRRHLQGLTNLNNLQFTSNAVPVVRGSMLAGMSQLTCLKANTVMPCFPSKMKTIFQAEALEGKTQLQHLEITNYQRVVTGLIQFMQDGTAELLSHLGTLQQLTYLSLSGTMGGTSPCWLVDAYSALTASTKLHHLNISGIDLQGGAWQYILPAGRQLPHLTALHFSDRAKASPSGDAYPTGPEGNTLVSCCPALRCLSMSGWQFSAALLASLTGLSSLKELRLQAEAGSKGLEAVCQLTGLRQLHLGSLKRYDDAEGFPLQLTELQQLTYLEIIDEKDRLGVPRNYPQQAKLAIAGDQMFMLRFICEVSVNVVRSERRLQKQLSGPACLFVWKCSMLLALQVCLNASFGKNTLVLVDTTVSNSHGG
jgi:Leucine-rich repeat (LRR) protein